MAKHNSAGSLPKFHTMRHDIAEEVAHFLYSGKDGAFKKAKSKEIENWMANGNFYGTETPAEIAREW